MRILIRNGAVRGDALESLHDIADPCPSAHIVIEPGIAVRDNVEPGAFLIDVSRGGILVESALVQALRDQRLAGAVLDVFEQEPLPDASPLWDLPRVIITPHCSSVFEGWERRAAEMFCDNLARWIDGQPLANVVDPKRGY